MFVPNRSLERPVDVREAVRDRHEAGFLNVRKGYTANVETCLICLLCMLLCWVAAVQGYVAATVLAAVVGGSSGRQYSGNRTWAFIKFWRRLASDSPAEFKSNVFRKISLEFELDRTQEPSTLQKNLAIQSAVRSPPGHLDPRWQ